MAGPKCAAGHNTVSMLYIGDGNWKCPKCFEYIRAGHQKAEAESPEGLNLEETLWVLRNTPHEPYERPPQVLEAFERLMQRIEGEPEDQETEVIRDASENLDKYIYG